MIGFVANVQHVGGQFFKMPRNEIMGAFPVQTSVNNLRSYFQSWPKMQARFLVYGSTRFGASNKNRPQLQQGPLLTSNQLRNNSSKQTNGPDGASGYLQETRKKFGLRQLGKNHREGKPSVVMTCYDATTATIASAAGIDILLVGDSFGNVKLGYDSTVPVTMEDMLLASKAVVRGNSTSFVIGDMPFGSYLTVEDALRNSSQFMKVGCDAVKLEGGERVADVVQILNDRGIPVMAHVGLTPQSYVQLGGYGTQGASAQAALRLIDDAKAVEAAGAFAVVLEKVPEELAQLITEELSIPTIGIGAGKYTSGQVLVCDDLLGMSGKNVPSFVKKYSNLYDPTREAILGYAHDVRTGQFPAPEHSCTMKEEELTVLLSHYPYTNLAQSRSPSQQQPDQQQQQPDQEQQQQQEDTNVKPRSMEKNVMKDAGGGDSKGRVAIQKEKAQSPQHLVPHSFPTMQHGNLGLRNSVVLEGTIASRSLVTKAAPAHTFFLDDGAHRVADNGHIKLPVFCTIKDMRAWRRSLRVQTEVGFVPTMGKFHEGHFALVDAAFEKGCEAVVVSIFVNGAQFAAHEDFGAYPRELSKDIATLQARYGDKNVVVFAPSSAEMYPRDPRALDLTTSVVPDGVKGAAEVSARPTFFRGVATVCTMLFHIVNPDHVFFGQKDATQCVVIRNLVQDLHFPLTLTVVPSAREENGLAMSSRNNYLTTATKDHCAKIYQSLQYGVQNAHSAQTIKAAVRSQLEDFTVCYVSVADENMQEYQDSDIPSSGSIVSVAVSVTGAEGLKVRLLDNIVM